MNKLQAVYQLQTLRKSIESEDWESPKIKALEIAIFCIEQTISKEKPCYFDREDSCYALVKKDCFSCKFRKTKEEYVTDEKRSRERRLSLMDKINILTD